MSAETFADEAGRYRLDERIATGGMGTIWRSTDTVLGRTVAVKLLKDEYADNTDFRARFAVEARSAAALHHPGVASVFDFGNEEGSPPFLVMELVDGHPLDSLLRPGTPMPPEAARDLIAQAAEAVAVAHDAGIVHRDLKPGNLLVTADRQVKITDFGIARAADGVPLTETGQIVGTPQYISPEQAEGKSAGPASDVYALGVVLFECLAGRRPFVAETPVAIALAHLRDPVPDLPDTVPADLVAVTRRALTKDPDERYADGAELAAALRGPAEATGMFPVPAAVAPATAETMTFSSPEGAAPFTGRAPRRTALLAVVPLVLAFALLMWLLSATGAEEDPQPGPPPATSTPETITLDPDDYVGRPVDPVARELRRLELAVKRVVQDNPGDRVPGNVAGLAPRERLTAGEMVTVTVWGPRPVVEEPPTTGESGGGGGDDKSGGGDKDPGKSQGDKKGGPPKGTPGKGKKKP